MSEQQDRDREQIERAWFDALLIWTVVLVIIFGGLLMLILRLAW